MKTAQQIARQRFSIGVLGSLALAFVAAGAARGAAAVPELRIHGGVHALMSGSDGGAPAVTLDASSLTAETVGLGALPGMRGEVTIVDGRCWVSTVGDEGVETSMGDGLGVEAGFLVLADVGSWVQSRTAVALSFTDLAEHVRALGTSIGIDPEQALVFRVTEALPRLKGHVVDGSRLASGLSPERRHDLAVSVRRFRAQAGVLLGFVSSRHEGVLTHSGETMHAHAVLADDNLTVHVDALKLPPGTTLALGTRSLTAREWMIRADAQYSAGAFAESADSYARSIQAGAVNPTTFYNAACAASLAGRVGVAFQHLDGALARGFRDSTLLKHDSDLAPLHGDPRWSSVVERSYRAEAVFAGSLGAPELREELLEMKRMDQAARRGEDLPELEGRGMGDVDDVNTSRMKEIVARHGWPVPNLVGEDGARAAWLLVQHADRDPAFQRECLELMTRLPPTEVSPIDLAYLTDRVLVNEGGKQLYGTQFWTVDGELVPRPIEDEAGVEARRSAAGMISMSDYTERMTGRR